VDPLLKKLLLLSLVLVFVLALTTGALAEGITPVDTSVAGEGGYSEPTPGVDPHGSYTVATDNCQTCHAVHGATPGGEALLRTTKADACVYCHVSGTFAIAQPYGTDPAAYENESENNHAAGHQDTGYSGCTSCHSVHGANIWSNAADGITYGMILRNDPGATIGAANNQGAIKEPVATLTDFCRDCHDGTSLAQRSYRAADDTTCAGNCHSAQMLVANAGGRDGVSHIMTTTLTGKGVDASGNPVKVASLVSSDCRSCHKGAAIYVNGNSFPHLTSGADFLVDTHTATSGLDGVCLDCHQWSGGGVGTTF
jgi:predicted CXXCH cytochrome family protein